MKKVAMLLCITGLLFGESSSHAESSSSSSSSSSSQSFSKTITDDKVSSNTKKYVESSNGNEVLFSLGKNTQTLSGSLFVKQGNISCEFTDKELTKNGSTYVFKDRDSGCIFTIKNNSKSISVDYTKTKCINAGYCKIRQ